MNQGTNERLRERVTRLAGREDLTAEERADLIMGAVQIAFEDFVSELAEDNSSPDVGPEFVTIPIGPYLKLQVSREALGGDDAGR